MLASVASIISGWTLECSKLFQSFRLIVATMRFQMIFFASLIFGPVKTLKVMHMTPSSMGTNGLKNYVKVKFALL